MSAVLEPRDRGHRWRHLKLATAVAFYLAGHGLPATLRQDRPSKPVKISEAISDGNWTPPSEDTGDIDGLALWSLHVRSDYRHDSSGALDAAEAGKGNKRWAAVLQYRRAPSTADQQFCLVSLATLAEIIALTERHES